VSDESTKAELQDELRDRDLPVSGTKAELQQRLEDAKAEAAAAPTKAELQDELRDRDLPVSGTKKELQQRLEDAKAEDEKAEDEKAADDETDAKGEDDETEGDAPEEAAADDGGEPDAEPVEAADEQEAEDASEPARSTEQPAARPPGAREIARLAARELASLTRHTIEGISGLARDGDEWRVDVEVLEVSRVPPSTDVLGTYAVWVDERGELVSYERVGRFVRGQAGGGEG
jgi:hypothetical protein